MTCAVKWCGKASRSSNYEKDGITFHRFPTCPERKAKWIDATGRDGWFPTINSVICSRHFTEDSFHLMKNRRRVMNSAEPTLYLPILAPTPITKQTDAENFVNIPKPKLASSSCTELISSNVKDTEMPSTSENTLCNSLVKREVRSPSPIADTPAASEMPSTSENTLCNSLVKREVRSPSPIADTPAAYDSPDKKRLCRRIIELRDIVEAKNKKLRKFRDCNRRLKRKIVTLKSLLAKSKKKNLILAEHKDVLDSVE